MNNTPLISVITPCYNGEKYLKPFLDSLLTQTYTAVEFFFINDGSTDKTEEIFFQYKPLLEQKGWTVLYHRQENGGAAKAVNYGLARFTGEFLTWPDSDDILYPNFLSRRVEYMQQHPDCDILFHNVDVCSEENLALKKAHSSYFTPQHPPTFDTMFHHFLFAPSLCSFVRSSVFLQALPSRHIYDENRGGQNYQLVFPLLYQRKAAFLQESLACYVERNLSHSHIQRDPIVRLNEYTDLLRHAFLSITAMPETEKNRYLRLIKKRYRKQYFSAYIRQTPLHKGARKIYHYLKRIFHHA